MGPSQYNPIFSFKLQFQGRVRRDGGGHGGELTPLQDADFHVTSIAGHLMECDFPNVYHRKWGQCDPVELFTAPVAKFVPDVGVALSASLMVRRIRRTCSSCYTRRLEVRGALCCGSIAIGRAKTSR